MIVFQLMGGLGNQMFIYAAAKSFSVQTGKAIKFEFDCPYPHIKYKYALNIFRLSLEFASFSELREVKPKRGIERRLFKLLGKNPAARLLKERREFLFNEEFFSTPDDSYVSGFWQTEKYFLPIEKIIRSDFKFKNPTNDIKNIETINRILKSNSVAIHIRRGDYVNIPSTSATHGQCSLEYYQQAISIIEEAISNPVFFFFSNDMNWVKKNFQIGHEHYFVDNNKGELSFEDLRLISMCKHAIIANSSFSWWGAWLNENPDKMIVAPKSWMKDPNIDTKDLIPSSWTSI